MIRYNITGNKLLDFYWDLSCNYPYRLSAGVILGIALLAILAMNNITAFIVISLIFISIDVGATSFVITQMTFNSKIVRRTLKLDEDDSNSTE